MFYIRFPVEIPSYPSLPGKPDGTHQYICCIWGCCVRGGGHTEVSIPSLGALVHQKGARSLGRWSAFSETSAWPPTPTRDPTQGPGPGRTPTRIPHVEDSRLCKTPFLNRRGPARGRRLFFFLGRKCAAVRPCRFCIPPQRDHS